MADYVVSRHSAVMERLRRRIELFRRHHNNCESRYDNTAMERLELERQQTFALHQRCLQTKAKRSNKHRQPQTGSEQAAQRSTGNAESAEGGGGGAGGGSAPGEQSRNSTLIALHETVKRKLENASPPSGRDQVNGFSDGYPQAKKSCLEDALGSLNGTSNGGMPPLSPMDTKHGVAADLALNGAPAVGTAEQNGVTLATESDIRLKELKQEPMDDILPTGGGNGNIILPDLNLNEQEWTELMEEFNRSVPYEEIQELFNDGFEDRKESEVPSGTVAPTSLLPTDLAGTVKAEFSPAPASSAFEQDTRTGSPHIPSTSSGPPMHASSPIMPPASASSPALTGHQHTQQQPSQPRPLQTHLMPPKDLSPAQQLQQLAAREQQRAQLMQNQHQAQKQQKQQQQQQQQPTPKFHQQSNLPSTWQSAPPNQSPLGGGAFGQEKPNSPSLYSSDFQNPKPLLMPGQHPSKGSPKANAPGAYMQPSGHPMMGHGAAPSGTLSHQPASGGQTAMLDYNNTKPLSHFEAGAPRGPVNPQSQNKAAMLNLLRQHQHQHQQQQQMKPRPTGMPFRPPTHLPHTQEPGTYPSTPHVPGPGAAMVTQPGSNGMAANHNNAAYLSLQKQQMQMMTQQQKQFLQRQMMAEQEKQRQQQEQQMQRHLTRPPPQYQDQQNPPTQQNPFQQQPQVSQFPGSSQPMGSVNSLGGPAPGVPRMFPQNQSMMGINQGGGPAPGAPPAGSQADLSLSSCAGGLEAQQVIYGNMPMHPSHANQQRLPVSPMQNYRHNVLAQQQAHLKQQQQQLARMPNNMPGAMANNMSSMPSSLPNTITSNIQAALPPQAQSWQQQQQQHPGLQQGMAGQPNTNNGALPAGFPNSNFHMQPRMTKLPGSAPFNQAGLGNGAAGRAMVGMNPGQMMPNVAQHRANSGTMAQQQPQQGQSAPPQSQQVLPDLGPFGQPQGGQVPTRTASMQCNQAYQVNRTPSQQMPFAYNAQSAGGLASFPGESDLVDSLLKNQSTQEWMDDLDELLASHQ
ncbi:mastermind-like protein 1 isoform X2 [Hemibagrus wyckioides]|uniref:mastermind-like protein 1 isoform X2 n=1 Tax=Hemibagrus wyckioides TaxID=337641 RepID=UPI00266D0ECE|nr:mastermind-like protein 1 isoform X2 [Hemibagrus wyckioides]